MWAAGSRRRQKYAKKEQLGTKALVKEGHNVDTQAFDAQKHVDCQDSPFKG